MTYLLTGFLILGVVGLLVLRETKTSSVSEIGDQIDSLNGVSVYYNGRIDNVSGRNRTEEGYNLGLKYQCVEFVKRYYYEHLNHEMPDSWGHAKDFFDNTLADGQKNKRRDLIQYTNPSQTKPKVDDLLVFDGTIYNRYGHVAIISNVTNKEIEIIQQNPGSHSKSRVTFPLENKNGKWIIKSSNILGRLSKR